MTTETTVEDLDKSTLNSSPVLDNGEEAGESETVEPEDEAEEIDPDHIEERFRVDRRKLEQMIQSSNKDELAEEFFLRIMAETNTHITWPSKLKIGAKSKKDPHIKISGHKDAVAEAKVKVMTVLDTKSTRVTLKMDVSYTEHSHVIGKGGNNIKHVMQETGCHIHFPDSNRSNQAEKSNQVSIAGQPQGVEQARAKIRDLLPLVFMFELPMTGVLQPLPDASSPAIKTIQDSFGVTVTFKQRPQVYMTTVIVRGTVCKAKSVKEATMRLIEQLTGNIGTTAQVSLQLEIAPQHHLFIMGRNGINIKQIMQHTGAAIHFPDPASTSQSPRKSSVYIAGPIDSVCLARQHLIGCLPLVLMFDMKEETEIDQGKLTQLMEQLDVFISIKPKPKQPSKSVIVKSIERNATNLYEARRRLLGEEGENVPVVRSTVLDGLTTNALNITNLGMLAPNMLKINGGPVLLLNGTTAAHSARLGSLSGVPGTTLSSLVTTPQGVGLLNPSVVLVPQLATSGAIPRPTLATPATAVQSAAVIRHQGPAHQQTLPNGQRMIPIATRTSSVSTTAQPSDLEVNSSARSGADRMHAAVSVSVSEAQKLRRNRQGSPPEEGSRFDQRNRERVSNQQQQVSVSVEARPAISQMQQQISIQQLQQQVAAMQRDINQNVHKTSHSPAQMSSPVRDRSHSGSSSFHHPGRHNSTTSDASSPPPSPPVLENHHPFLQHHHKSAFKSIHRPAEQSAPRSIHGNLQRMHGSDHGNGSANQHSSNIHHLHRQSMTQQAEINTNGISSSSLNRQHASPPFSHHLSIDELLRQAAGQNQSQMLNQHQLNMEELLRKAQHLPSPHDQRNQPIDNHVSLEELIQRTQQQQQQEAVNRSISIEDLLRKTSQASNIESATNEQLSMETLLAQASGSKQSLNMNGEITVETLLARAAENNKETINELLQKSQHQQRQSDLPKMNHQLSIEELLRNQLPASSNTDLANHHSGPPGLGVPTSIGVPASNVGDIASSLAMCNTLNDLINSQAPVASSLAASVAANSIVNAQLGGNQPFDLSSLVPNAGSSSGANLSALNPGTSILDILLPKLNMSQTNELFHQVMSASGNPPPLMGATAGGGANAVNDIEDRSPPTSSPEHPLLRSGSPPLPAHPPDSPGIMSPDGVVTSPHLRKRSIVLDDAGASGSMRNFTFQNGRVSPNHGTDVEHTQHDANSLGLRQPNPDQAISLFAGTPLFESIDYEQKKLLATKAMAKKPLGESRIPTDYWSGMGFSKSMPDHALKEQLRASGVKYKGPSMATTYENGDSELAEADEEDRDPWKDSPIASPSSSFNAGLRQHRATPRTPPTPHTPPSGTQPPSPLASPEYSPKRPGPDYGMARVSSPSMQDVDWLSPIDMAELFSKLGLGKYTYLFQEQEIDMATFLTLTDQDLKELGITTFGARRKMLLAIDDLNKRQTPISAAPGSNNPFRKTDKQMLPRRHDIASQSGRW